MEERYAYWVVIGPAPSKGWRGMATCRCECGTVRIVSRWQLEHGGSKSCGCQRGRFVTAARVTHGHATGKWSPTYGVWRCILARTGNPNNYQFNRYGGRGITVCERWLKYENFLQDMGERPAEMTIERVDNNDGYRPGNCIWATKIDQARNRRTNRMVTHNGETMCVAAWAERTRMPVSTILSRLHRGWSAEKALTWPLLRNGSGVLARAALGAAKPHTCPESDPGPEDITIAKDCLACLTLGGAK